MKFDSNRVWLEAMAAIRANRQVLVAVAGVFFLLPTLLSTVFLTDVQTQVVEAMGKPEVMQGILSDNIGLFLGFGIGGMLIQGLGYLTVMALLSERGRLTVGEAIAVAFKALPTLIVAALLGGFGMFGLLLLAASLIGKVLALAIGVAAATTIVVIASLVAAIYVSVKLSLIVPVVINEGVGNPLAAMIRSWRLTKGNSLRLFGFFALLMIGYIVIASVATIVLAMPAALLLGQGQALILFMGIVSGVLGAVTSVILTAILAYIHRQLAGPSAETISQTFE